MTPEQIKSIRSQLGMSQQAFAAALGVSFATVNRWENGKAKPQKDRLNRVKALLHETSVELPEPASSPYLPVRLDFEGDATAVKLVVDAHRLQNGHLFNKAFGLELSRVVPLPHQRIAVYEHMLPQNPTSLTPSGRRASSLAVLSIGEIQDLADQIHALTKPLAGLDPQIEVRITVMSKGDGDLSEANNVLNKIKSGWKL